MLAWTSLLFLYVPFSLRCGFIICLVIARIWYKGLKKPFVIIEIDDACLELMLRFMDIYFQLNEDFRRHIDGFEAKYLFKTQDGSVAAAFSFKNGDMEIEGNPGKVSDDLDAIVVFKDRKALRDSLKGILFKGRLDILDLMLENRVHVYRNVSYVFRFLFLVNDLRARFLFKAA